MAAKLVSLNNVVNEFFATTKQFDRKTALTLKVVAKRTIIDLGLNILSKTKRKFVKVKQQNGFRYVEMPDDYYMFGTAAVVDDRRNIQPLSRNEFMNITPEVVEEDCEDRKCKTCGQVASEVCFEAQHFEAITEDVSIPETVVTLCDYTANISSEFPYTFYGIASSNGFATINTVVNNQGELDTIMDGAGFTKVTDTIYKITQTEIIYDFIYILTNEEVPQIEIITLAVTNCNQSEVGNITYQKVTTLKVCDNGDVTREICEPVVINTPNQTLCDYNLNLTFDETLCDYEIVFNPELQACTYCFDLNSVTYPINNATVVIGGISYNSGSILNSDALGAWLTTLGFTYDAGAGTACIEDFVPVISDLIINYVTNSTTIEVDITGCDTNSDRYPYWIYSYIKNGSSVPVNIKIADYSDLLAFFVSIGFTEDGTNDFIKDNSSDVFTSITYSIYAPNTINDTVTVNITQSNCVDLVDVVPPFTFKSYSKNLVVTTLNTAINTNADLLAAFSALGIYNSASGEFVVYQSSDIWDNVVITYNGTDFTFPFTATNCFTTTTHVVETDCRTIVECNVPLKPCGCVDEVKMPLACTKIQSCCSDILSCCQKGTIKKYANDFPYPEAPNPFGGFKFDEDTNRIYLDDYFCGDKVLITYRTDGSIGGKYFIPDYSVEAALAGIYWRSIRFDKRVGLGEKSYAERQYGKAKDTLFRELNPINLGELSRALQSMQFFVAPLMRSSRQLFFNNVVSNRITNN